MKNKIVAVVKCNSGEALVLEKPPKLVYEKHGGDTIIGTDGMFYSFYGYDAPSKNWEAFAGRKFTIELKSGEIVNCHGQWWDMVTKRAISVLGINDTDKMIIHVTAESVDELKKCYVFAGYRSIGDKISEFRKTYTGEVYDYYEYEKIIRNK